MTRGDKDCPGHVWVAGARQDGQKRADMAPARSTNSRLPERTRGTSLRRGQIPEVSQLFSAWSPAVSHVRESSPFTACLVLPAPPGLSPSLALGEQDPGSNIPLGSAT